ncbi:MAG TPA: hypothetical protein VK906_03890, partial [Egicoccus sp.]
REQSVTRRPLFRAQLAAARQHANEHVHGLSPRITPYGDPRRFLSPVRDLAQAIAGWSSDHSSETARRGVTRSHVMCGRERSRCGAVPRR